MKCSSAQHWMALPGPGPMPDEVRRHVDHCEPCRTAWKTQEGVRLLLSLKRHEQPDPGFAERNVQNVLRRIRLSEAEKPSFRAWLSDFVFETQPAFRFALAAVLAVLIAAGAFVWLRARPAPSGGAQVADSSTNRLIDNAGPVADGTTSTNPDPSRIQYGTRPSAVVDFKE